MLVFDQLKKNDPQLRLLAAVIFGCLFVLLAGLWWVQIVHARDYRASLETQSYRTVRVPAVRGKILDRNGVVLAENRPNYSIGLYLEDLSDSFRKEYQRIRPMQVITNSLPAWQTWLGFDTVKTQRAKLTKSQISALEWQARYQVGDGVVRQVANTLKQPLVLDFAKFRQHFVKSPALPYPVIEDLNPTQIARFEEQCARVSGVDLEIESMRVYPRSNVAAHILGYVRRNNDSVKGEEAFYSYRLADFRGVVGIEGHFDDSLRGRAGAKAVLVNNLGYRQTENIWNAAEPGRNVVLTLDLRLQVAAERALRQRAGNNVRGAVVVMDVRSGDILALVSAPASDPNYLVQGFPLNEYSRWTNATLGLQKNRATQENYQAGSIFKTIIALAALESGLNPHETYRVAPNPRNPHRGIVHVGKQAFDDTATPGDYDLRRAILKSSNSYFITMGRRAGIEKIIELGTRLHLGERMNIPTRQETGGSFPTLRRVKANWRDGDTANICIGQGELAVTPMQMAVMTCALANGGKVLWPRLVARIESPDSFLAESPIVPPAGRIRDELGVSPRNLQLIREAMLADTEDSEGTGQRAAVPGLHICGKTGTAERREHGQIRNTTWFVSFAPADNTRYAVVVMVEDGVSGGVTCAPVARDIYEAIQKIESDAGVKSLAQAN
jgi:penicillin-binding protein 2